MRILYLIVFIGTWNLVFAQQIEQRILFIGDAGEINPMQKSLLVDAAGLVIAGKTQVFFLGDNIYPVGMGLEEEKAQLTASILQSQYSGFIERDVPVSFLAGNHDWDKSGSLGLRKVIAQANFLKSQHNSLLNFVPEAGTAGPVVKKFSDRVTAVLYDSEYWLFPHHANPDSALEGEVRKQFFADIATAIRENEGNAILFISHHPLRSYGEHGLTFSWRDHLFPLTRIWKPAYLPLPGVGSIFPLVRSTVLNSAEDLKHPVYKRFIRDMRQAVGTHKNIVFVSGHDHGLQWIVDQNFRQIVSGSGAKSSIIQPSKALKYQHNQQGFCVLDCMDDGSLDLSFYIEDKGRTTKAFQQIIYPN
ncbi:metallophosphoesterase [Sphingobacterium paludis]|uniref:Calcineurin-like phosphoesterase family protein n=1 Tax=Sphingobacterium paludis TaxID=1476465 RepID=A0A4R7D868_9SPHI|nr:metallophosphoesterase [Sphingobacterium paludis]TDS17443.1 calcineurin-like phosphoesterase family protein [Sphingobacterium paludis]